MKKTVTLPKRLDDPNGIGQDNPNKTMNAPKAPWFLRLPAAVLRKCGLAVLAVGVEAASSFLKSKMEKAAAVASKVVAVVLKSKKAILAEAAALVRIRPERPKKARLPSAPILALLAIFFASSPQGMTSFLPPEIWTPGYERRTFVVDVTVPDEESWSEYGYYYSNYTGVSDRYSWILGRVEAKERIGTGLGLSWIKTIHYIKYNKWSQPHITIDVPGLSRSIRYFGKNSSGKEVWRRCSDVLDLMTIKTMDFA